MKMVRLGDFVENPDNPQTVTDDAFDRLVGKLRRVPDGLTAKRIAYVTDHSAGKFVVLSGNKRLRALKILHGDNGKVPADWFQDITAMGEAERNEFIVDANVVEGKFDADKLLKMYARDELTDWMGADALAELIDIAGRPAESATGGNASGASDGVVEFAVKLSVDDYNEAVAYLRKVNEDISKAFVEVVCGNA